MTPEEQKLIDEKELRISQLEKRIEKIDEQIARAKAGENTISSVPALDNAKIELMKKSVEAYGQLSPFYGKV